jgi:hypothetical protein
LLVPTNAGIAFCNSVGGVSAEQFIHEERASRTDQGANDGRTDGSPRRVAGTRQQSVLAQIGLTISVSNRRRLVRVHQPVRCLVMGVAGTNRPDCADRGRIPLGLGHRGPVLESDLTPRATSLYGAAEESGGGSSPVSQPCNHATLSRSLASALALLALFMTSISYAV